ncbi:MAG: M24 family metallopeptidase, partial [Candidatus Diapherotrites archaeon]|nr:M24 family metallopeptidase [Candidatus Diapherotrites archaeon]
MQFQKLESIKAACKITDSVFSRFVKKIGSFRSEREVARFIIKEISKKGCKPSFHPIVGSAFGGAEPHHKPQNTQLKRGFCVIDFGVKVGGYCSDMTRTVFFGKPSKKERSLYNLVLFAQKKVVESAKAGSFGKDLWKLSFDSLGAHRSKFIHGLGHGLGKHIHVKPFLKKKSKDVLKEGDIVTIE